MLRSIFVLRAACRLFLTFGCAAFLACAYAAGDPANLVQWRPGITSSAQPTAGTCSPGPRTSSTRITSRSCRPAARRRATTPAYRVIREPTASRCAEASDRFLSRGDRVRAVHPGDASRDPPLGLLAAARAPSFPVRRAGGGCFRPVPLAFPALILDSSTARPLPVTGKFRRGTSDAVAIASRRSAGRSASVGMRGGQRPWHHRDR